MGIHNNSSNSDGNFNLYLWRSGRAANGVVESKLKKEGEKMVSDKVKNYIKKAVRII